VLAFWRAVQYRDAQGGIVMLTPAPKPGQRPDFESFIAKGASALAATTKPKIVSSRTSGDNAVVNLRIIRRDKVGQVVQEHPLGILQLDLVRGPSGWLINWKTGLPRLPAALK
jgi:hypothetical protein